MGYIEPGVNRGQSEAELGTCMVGIMGRNAEEDGKENNDAHRKCHRTVSMGLRSKPLNILKCVSLSPTCPCTLETNFITSPVLQMCRP